MDSAFYQITDEGNKNKKCIDPYTVDGVLYQFEDGLDLLAEEGGDAEHSSEDAGPLHGISIKADLACLWRNVAGFN